MVSRAKKKFYRKSVEYFVCFLNSICCDLCNGMTRLVLIRIMQKKWMFYALSSEWHHSISLHLPDALYHIFKCDIQSSLNWNSLVVSLGRGAINNAELSHAMHIRVHTIVSIRRERGPENDLIMKVRRSLEIWTWAENISVKNSRQDSPLAIALVSSGFHPLIGSFQTSSCPWNIIIHFSTYSWPFRLFIITRYQELLIATSMRPRTSALRRVFNIFCTFWVCIEIFNFSIEFLILRLRSTDLQNENKMYLHKEITNFIACMWPFLGILYQIRCNHSRWKKLN